MIRRLPPLAALLLGACTVGPDYAPPATQVPAAFVGPQPPGAAVDPAHWWRVFGDPELDSLVARALAGNPDIRIAASRIRQARLAEIDARAAGRPRLSVDANVSRVDFSKNGGFAAIARSLTGGDAAGGGTGGGVGGGVGGDDTAPPRPTTGVAAPGGGITTFAAGFDASWELDLFGRVARGREAALARTQAEVWTGRDAAVTLAAEVAQAYFALRLDDQQIAVVGDEIAANARTAAIVSHRADVGLVPRVDAVQATEAVSDARARLAPVTADRALRAHALALLTAQPPGALDAELARPLPALSPAPAIPAGLPSDLLRRRPDVRAAERRLAASSADIGAAIGDRYPKVSLTGALQLLSSALSNLLSTDSLQSTGTAAVSAPLLDGGRGRARVDSRREDQEQALADYDRVVLGGLRDVEDALASLDAERARRAALANAVGSEDRQLAALEARRRAGLIAEDPVLRQRAQALAARERLAVSEAQLRQSTVALFKALGGGWEDAGALDAARPDRTSDAVAGGGEPAR